MRLTDAAATSAVDVWFSQSDIWPVLSGHDGHALTADDVGRFALGSFISTANSTAAGIRPITEPLPPTASNGFMLATSGDRTGALVLRP